MVKENIISIQHKDIPESDLHEPKGASLAPANRVYISNGLGSGSWQKVPGSAMIGGTPGDVGKVLEVASDGTVMLKQRHFFFTALISTGSVLIADSGLTSVSITVPGVFVSDYVIQAVAPINSSNVFIAKAFVTATNQITLWYGSQGTGGIGEASPLGTFGFLIWRP